MLSRKFLAFLLIVKMATTQSVYPTTAVSYSTNSVPTIQTYPASVSAVPTVMSATVTTTAVPTSSISATCATPVPLSSVSSPTVSVTSSPLSSVSSPTVSVTSSPLSSVSSPTVSVTSSPLSPVSSPIVSVTATPISSMPKVISSPKTPETAEAKAYFLPANIPDPKVTILSNDKPDNVKPRLYEDVKPTFCSDILPSKPRKEVGPMTPVKRMTMACTDDAPAFLIEQTVCPGISKMELTPPPSDLKKEGSLKNPIDFEGLLDSFMTCL